MGNSVYGRGALRRALDRLSKTTKGERNQTLNDEWLGICQLIDKDHIDRAEAEQQFIDTALSIGLGHSEIRKTMGSAADGARRKPRENAPDPEDSQPPKYRRLLFIPTRPVDTQASIQFWESRPILTHIRDFARARRVSPWATLGVVLVRLAAELEPSIVLPALTGSHASLNTYVGLVGPSGAGKDAAIAAAADAVTGIGAVTVGVGSGEGIAHQYYHYVKPTKDDPVGGLEKHTESVIFIAAEVGTLVALQRRNSSTLWPEFRKAWNGSPLGFAYVAKEKRLNVPAHEYRCGLIVGVQPEEAGPLLDDDGAGTPQRFLWLPAVDTSAPDTPPAQPEPIKWQRITWPSTEYGQPVKRNVLRVCDTARDTIDKARLDRLRGNGDALDGHALLARLKTAALLGILDGHHDVTEADWKLAGTIMTVSDATRDRIRGVLDKQAEKIDFARGAAKARQEQSRDQTSVKQVCGAIMRKLADGEWHTASNLRRNAVSSSARGDFHPAIERLVGTGEIEPDDSGRGIKYRRAERSKS